MGCVASVRWSNEPNKRGAKGTVMPRLQQDLLFNLLPFDSEEFKEAWQDWEEHRKMMKEPLTPIAKKRQWRFLATLGEKKAIQAIDNSINHNWTGLFEPKEQNAPSYPIQPWSGKKYGE